MLQQAHDLLSYTGAEQHEIGGMPFLCVAFGRQTCWIAADSQSVRDELATQYADHLTPASPRPESGIAIETLDSGLVRLRVMHDGQLCSLPEILRGPEWKRFATVPDPSRHLYADCVLGNEPALEDTECGIVVLKDGQYQLYLSMFLIWLFQRDCAIVGIHAAVAAIDGHALVLAGASGSGKSTLSWALQQRGADYFGDEMAFFTLPEQHLIPLERALYLRPGGIEALGSSADLHTWQDAKPNDPKCTVELPKSKNECPRDRTIFIFMEGFAEAPHLEVMSGGEAARRLLQGMSFGSPSVSKRLLVAADLIDRYPCWSLTAGPPFETAELLIEHVRKGAASC